jgi:hypothetical protein
MGFQLLSPSIPPTSHGTAMGIASTSPSLSNQITVKVSPSAAPGAPTEPFSQPLTSRMLTLSEIDSRLRELQNALRAGGALQYFPGDQKNQETVVQRWIAQVGQFAELVQLLRRSQISQLHELEIRKNLTEAVTQLEFRRPYEVKLVGHTGAGKTTILAAILGEDFFPIWSGDTVTGARTRILFSDIQAEEMRIHFLDQQRPVENYERKDWQKTALKYIAQPLQSDGIFQAHDGAFRQLLHDLRQQMGHLPEDSEIRKQLQTMINKNRPQIDHWASVIKELEKIRDFRLAITEKMVV